MNPDPLASDEELEPREVKLPVHDNARGALRAYVERIERLEEEKQGLADDVKEVYGEAKAEGFDAAVMRKCIRLRKMDPADRAEAEAKLELYMESLR